jgi:hypothetical protein
MQAQAQKTQYRQQRQGNVLLQDTNSPTGYQQAHTSTGAAGEML